MGLNPGWDRPNSYEDLQSVWKRAAQELNMPTQIEEESSYISEGMPMQNILPYGEFNSFSGVDIVAYINVPASPGNDGGVTSSLGILGTLQTLSYSIHREVVPVRALGKVRAHSYTRGPRTIAGTMVWAVMDQYVLAEALRGAFTNELDTSSILADQLPPFDIVITFNNEYGDVSQMGLYGIRMVNEGSTMSIDDMLTEQTNTYVATDIDLLHRGKNFKDNRTGETVRTGDWIMLQEAKKRMNAHRSPFI